MNSFMENMLILQNCKKQCNPQKKVYADESEGRRDPLSQEAFMWRSKLTWETKEK